MTKETVYIALKDKISVDLNTKLSIGDLGEVFANNKSLEGVIGGLEVYQSPGEEDWDYIDANYVVTKAIGYNPSLDITMIGAS